MLVGKVKDTYSDEIIIEYNDNQNCIHISIDERMGETTVAYLGKEEIQKLIDELNNALKYIK